VNEADLRRQLDKVHRQMLERDTTFRFHERKIEDRDRQIHELRGELKKVRDWAAELESGVRRLQATIQEMEAAIGWRAEMRLRSMLERPRRFLRRDGRP
jgi:chromosome segregation ATPase